jgi:hypothetical protein
MTWQGKRDTFNAIRSSVIILVYIAFGTWVSYLLRDMQSQGRELSLASWIVLGVTIIYLLSSLVWRVMHVFESLMNCDAITINEDSVSIVRSGLGGLCQRARIPAAHIKYICQTMAGFNRILYLELTFAGELSTRFKPIALPAFCRGIGEADATTLLEKIQTRYPQYRDMKEQLETEVKGT